MPMPMPNVKMTPYERLFPRRHRAWLWAAAALLGLLILLGVLAATLWGLTVRRPVNSSGGLYFLRPVALDVQGFRQADPRWHDIPLGDTSDTLGQTGCAVTSAAIVLKFYGIDTDPQRLNDYLTKNGGYVGSGYIVWEKAAELSHGSISKAYEDLPSYWAIDWQLIRHNPVIVRMHLPGGGTHFVVIAGKRGFDYLIIDPGAGWSKGLYPLHDLTPRIDGLRYYTRAG